PARHVIHTVGPVWNGGGHHEPKKLADCYRNSLQLAEENNCVSIAFPNISTGIYHFPKDRAAAIAVTTVAAWLSGSNAFQKVIFVCFDPENHILIQAELDKLA